MTPLVGLCVSQPIVATVGSEGYRNVGGAPLAVIKQYIENQKNV